MDVQVRATGDPQQVLDEVGRFLAADPVRHNLILTLLHARVANPQPGRYWTVVAGGQPVGVVFRSPLDFIATATPMPPEAVTKVVDVMVDEMVTLPGVTAEAATAARFAGHWTERLKVAGHPFQGQRIYEFRPGRADGAGGANASDRQPVDGQLRRATEDDVDLARAWVEAFVAEVEAIAGDVAQRVRAGQIWFWDVGEAVSMLGVSTPVANTVRIGPVFTPKEHRNRGYCTAMVSAITAAEHDRGHRCILYTELGNPTSNSIYRNIGYQAVTEVLRYKFG